MSRLFMLMFALFMIAPLRAADIDKPDFSAQSWTTGLHLLAGLGVNTAYFESDLGSRDAGVGLNIQTSLSYFMAESFALEVSTNVMLNRIKRILIWDTLGTLGVRFPMPGPASWQNHAPYGRLFGGRGPSVLIYKGPRPEELEVDGDRTQISGNIFGFAYGFFQNAGDGSTWFLELVFTTHAYQRIETIVEKNQVPEVVSTRRIQDHSSLHAVALTFGVVAF